VIYRESPAQLCPRCAAAALREHDAHLVCDACHATLLPATAVATALTEIDGKSEVVEVRDLAPDAVKCPRCNREMQMCSLQRGQHMIPGRFHYCLRDGVCVPREVLAPSHTRSMTYASRSRSGVAGNPGAFRGAFRRAAPGVRGYEVSRPLVHTLFVSAFRGRSLECPACNLALELAGDRWRCTKCAGAFVEDAALAAMISDIVHEAWEMPAPAGKAGERECPVCARRMTEEQLEGVSVARCGGHGTWFDDQALSRALLHAGDPPGHPGGWLQKIFRRG
jgi:hypothetical protein